jgi:hypothetical protein
MAGKRIKCTKCGGVIAVPAGEEAAPPVETARPQAAPSRPAAPARDDFGGEPTRRHKKKGSAMPLVLGLVALLVLVGAALAVDYFVTHLFFPKSVDVNIQKQEKKELPPAIKYLPDNTALVIAFRPAYLLKSDAWDALKKAVPNLEMMLSGQALGKPADVGTVVYGTDPNDVDVTVLETLYPKASEKSKKGGATEVPDVPAEPLAAKLYQGMKSQDVAGHKVYEDSSGKNALCVADKHIIVKGPPALVRQGLERKEDTPKISKSFQNALEDLDFTELLVAAVDFPALQADIEKKGFPYLGAKGADAQKWFAANKGALPNSVEVVMNAEKEKLTFTITGNFGDPNAAKVDMKDSKAAKEAGKVGDAAREKVEAALKQIKAEGPLAGILNAVKNADVSSAGTQVTATVVISMDTFAKTMKQMGQ